jgi:hypothetical protein
MGLNHITTKHASIYVGVVGFPQHTINVSIEDEDIDLDIFDAEELVYLLNKAIDEAKRNGAE